MNAAQEPPPAVGTSPVTVDGSQGAEVRNDADASTESTAPDDMEWKHYLSHAERQRLETQTEFAQGMLFTAVIKNGAPPAQAGTIQKQPPMKHSEFVGLSARTGNWNLYLGKSPGPGADRNEEI